MSDKTEINLERIRAYDAGWNESQHPRAKNGRFSSGHGARSSLPANKRDVRIDALRKLAKVAGEGAGKMPKSKQPKKPKAPKYTKEEGYKNQIGKPISGGYKGMDAINKLIETKSGYIPDAFVRRDIGGIALPWGDDWMGLKHIIQERISQGIDPEEFLPKLADVIEHGELKTDRGRCYIRKDKYTAVVSRTYFDDDFTFVLTGWDENVQKK